MHRKILISISSAFTIAEILIVMGIIGIVAELTIPDLVKSYEKQVIVTKVKEIYSILSQSTIMIINNDCGGGDISSVATSRNDIANLYKKQFKVAKDCTDGVTTGCFATKTYKYLDNSNWTILDSFANVDSAKLILQNGMSIAFNGTPDSFLIYADINNIGSPNQWGKDLFMFRYDVNISKSIKPYPDGTDCNTNPGGRGSSCSYKIIQEGAVNYY